MEPFIGMIVQFGGNFAPRGWALCDGQLLPISSNSALFSILGTTYGGDGKSTFALPDLRGRVAMQPGTGPGLSARQLGQKGGAETVTLTVNQMPGHNHALNALADDARVATVANNTLAQDQNIYSSSAPNAAMNAACIGNTGGSQPFGVVQPFLCVNFIIALQGLFPSRN